MVNVKFLLSLVIYRTFPTPFRLNYARFSREQRLTKAFCQCPLLMVFRPHQPHLRYRILFVDRQPAHFTELDALKGGREDRYPRPAATRPIIVIASPPPGQSSACGRSGAASRGCRHTGQCRRAGRKRRRARAPAPPLTEGWRASG